MIFTIGNLITLGIVALALILYRLLDKNNRPLERVKKYTEKCKEEIAAYAEEKSMAVKNFGIDLDVEKKAALQLMKNIQKLTEEDLAKKSEAIARIEEQINAFESSLDELFGMTDRVQENLSRIRDESAFVENTGKRVIEAKEKFEHVERALGIAEKNLEEAEERLERKNAETLEQTAREVTTQVKSIVSDFEATAGVIESKIEEHREAVIKAERERDAVFTRDMELVKKTFKDVLENAGKRADKMEEAALVKLREQAQERVNQIKVFFEEKIKSVQEALKTEQGTVSEKLKVVHEKLNAEILDVSTKQKTYHQEFVKNSAELNSMAKKQKEEITASLAKQQEEVSSALTKERDTINTAMVQQQNDWKENFLEFKKLAAKQHKELDTEINASKTELNQFVTELRTKTQAALKQQQEELDAAVKLHQKEISTAIGDLKEKSAAAIKQQQQETGDLISKLDASMTEIRTKSENFYTQQQKEFSSTFGGLKEKTDAAVRLQHEELSSALGDLKKKTDTAVRLQQGELSSALDDLKEKTDTAVRLQHEELSFALGDIKEKTNTAVKLQQEELSSALSDIKEKTVTAVKRQQEELSSALGDLKDKTDAAIVSQHSEIDASLKAQMESWKTLCEDTEQGIITATEKRLEDYSRFHSEAAKQLNSLADDASRLESELRLSMQESVARVKNDFSVFEKETGVSMENTAAAFNTQIQALKKEIEEMDKELNGLRQQAYDNVSEKLTIFEKDFTAELGKRASEIGRQIADWQMGLQERLENSAGKITGDWQQAEERITLEQRKSVAALGEKITADLERLKQEAAAFELGMREEMNNVDETRSAFAEQIKQDLAEIRVTAENEVKAQIGRYQISMQETLRLNQRELEKEIEEITEHSKNAYAALDETAINTRQTFDEWQISYNTRMREMDTSLENLRRHSRETAAENDERISVFRQSLEDIRKELGVQKKIFDQTGELKQNLEHRMEEINADLNKLDLRKNEIIQLENQFMHIKRLEDEIQRKITSILSEKHRIEVMEKDFESLLKISQSIEEKKAQVSTSDDILSEVQVKIRRLEDSLKKTEEKYQRIERKNEVLEETNEGIDRNFKALQKTEFAIKNTETTIGALSDQFDNLRSSIETLAAKNEKATDAVEKIAALDESLSQIEQRIADMNVAREWVARTETELKNLDKEIRNQLKLTKSLLDHSKGKKTPENDKGVTPQDRDNVIRLRNQGWTVKEIADTMNLSISEVELILEIGSRD